MLNTVKNISDLSREEKRKFFMWYLYEKENKSTLDLPYSCIHEQFEARVKDRSSKTAVVFGDEEFTYEELNSHANQLGHYLQLKGVEPGVLVCIYMKRSFDMLVGLLGILKSGGAYVLLESTCPKEELAFIVKGSKVQVILTHAELLSRLPRSHDLKIISLDKEWDKISAENEENPVSGVTAEDLAYLTYSSRRGVLVEHRHVYRRLANLQKIFPLTESDGVLHKTSLWNDMAMLEIIWPLVFGGRLVIADIDDEINPAYMEYLISAQKVSIVHFAPSDLLGFIEHVSMYLSTQLSSLRLVLCSGEPLKQSVVDLFFQYFECKLYNLYSLPEAGGEVTCQACKYGSDRELVPIGRPIQNAVYVLDTYMQPVPLGVSGEIYVGGGNLSRGYLEETEHSVQRFIEDPFSGEKGAHLFKTGDLGRRLKDGGLELLRPIHRQAWIKGSRVDFENVERVLLEFPLIADCRVLARESKKSGSQLVAYMVPKRNFSIDQIQKHLEDHLPAHMMPYAYIPLSTLPLSTTGMVDDSILVRKEVIDTDLIEQWEDQLQSLPEVDKVAVVVQENIKKSWPSHLSDLILDWKPYLINRSKEEEVNLHVIKKGVGTKDLAITHGEELAQDTDAPIILSEALYRTVLRAPEKGITYIQPDNSEQVQSYMELLEEAERILTGLKKLGMKPHDKVIFQLDRNEDFLPAFWGCILGGFVPVPISVPAVYEASNNSTRRFLNAWQILDRPIVLSNGPLYEQIRSLSEDLHLDRFRVEMFDELRCFDPDGERHLSRPEDLALLLFTSGSTGTSKGVMLTHGNLLSNVASSAHINNLTNEDISLNWLRLDHVGGLVRCSIRDIYIGSQQIHAPTETFFANPLCWLDWIEQYKVTFAWAPNFALGLLNEHAEAIKHGEWDLSTLKSVLSVAEPIVPRTAKRFFDLLAPHGLSVKAMHSAWGMSETCAAVVFSLRYLSHRPYKNYPFVEVGRPMPGLSLRVVDEQDQTINEDTIGRVQIIGPMVTCGYYGDPDLDREAFTDDGWLKTGDMGFLHKESLTITGREKDVIIINGVNYSSHEIEAVVEEVEGVEPSYTAACAVRKLGGDTDELVIFFYTTFSDNNRLAELLKDILGDVSRKIGINPSYLIPVEREIIPKTSTDKIQRFRLKEDFEAGEFDNIIKRVDILLGNAHTLPSWFYRRIWRRKETVLLNNKLIKGQCLVFLDSLGLGAFLCTELDKRGQSNVGVEVGAEFAKLSETSYRIDPKNPEDYRLLVKSVLDSGQPIVQILHLWGYKDDEEEISSLENLERSQEEGVYSMLFLIQALDQVQGSETSVRMHLITSHAQPTSSGEKVAFERTPVIGLIKTIPYELPWLDCRHIDLSVEAAKINAEYVLREVHVVQRDQEVAYRNGQRLVPRLKRVDLRREKKREIPFKHGGMYLLSGGLGEIGLEIARYLLEHYEARLLLLGRTVLPGKETWESHLKRGDEISNRIRDFMELEELRGDVIYSAVDICDLDQLRETVEKAKSRWQCDLDGIIHLARVTEEHLVKEETMESFASILRPKVTGTWVLHELIKDQPDAVFINFSSVVSLFGAYSMGAYAAANSFVDSFSFYQRLKRFRSYCFVWSIWEGVGLNRKYQMRELSRSRGYYTIPTKAGINSLIAGLSSDQEYLIVGLDGCNSYMQSYMETEAHSLQKLTAYFTVTDGGFQGLPQGSAIHDRFQVQSRCDLQLLKVMPLTETGEVDRKKLLDIYVRRASAKKVMPRTKIERQVARIWEELLRIDQIGIHDNFFELGGHSLLAMQIIFKLHDELDIELPLRVLFEVPTIESLAKKINNNYREVYISETDESINAEEEDSGWI